MGVQVELWPGSSFTCWHDQEKAAAGGERELKEMSTAEMEDGSLGFTEFTEITGLEETLKVIEPNPAPQLN